MIALRLAVVLLQAAAGLLIAWAVLAVALQIDTLTEGL